MSICFALSSKNFKSLYNRKISNSIFFCKHIPCPIINCRLVFEFSPTGAVLPMSDFRTVKLLKYVSWADYFTMACEFVFYGFVVYYCIEEAIEIRKHSFAYFTYIWNIMDLAVLAVSIYQNHFKTILKYSINQVLLGSSSNNICFFTDVHNIHIV